MNIFKNNMKEKINYKLIAERLWGILDDIDCAFDHYKPDMKNNFVNYVDKKSTERCLYANSLDGQTLTFNEEIPILESLDPMCKWFKDAWIFEKDLNNKPNPIVPKISTTNNTGMNVPSISNEIPEKENIEVKLHNTTDAQVWTDEFIKTLRKVFPEIFDDPNCLVSKRRYDDFKEWIFGWFCNAIQTGIDLTNSERDNQYIYILQSNSGEIVDIYSYEPLEYDMNSSYREFLRIDTQPDASINCTLYRYNKYKGLQCWNGKAELETKYNWKDEI